MQEAVLQFGSTGKKTAREKSDAQQQKLDKSD